VSRSLTGLGSQLPTPRQVTHSPGRIGKLPYNRLSGNSAFALGLKTAGAGQVYEIPTIWQFALICSPNRAASAAEPGSVLSGRLARIAFAITLDYLNI
jgi:hypothetical protein